MKKLLLAITAFIFLASPAFATIRTAASCSQAHVATAVAAATYGDTVTIPAGSCTWLSELVITKYMTIQGAGSGGTGTNITQNIDDTAYALIKYVPDATSIADDGLFRVTAIKFDGDSGCPETTTSQTGCTDRYASSKGIYLYSAQTTKFLKNIRIDNCSFYNFRIYTGNSDTYGQAIDIKGLWFGLIDNNYFRNCRAVYCRGWYGANWTVQPVDLGTVNAIYIEDNYFYKNSQHSAGGAGSRYVARFNKSELPLHNWDVWDAHGNSYGDPRPSDSTSRGAPSNENYCNYEIRNTSSAFRYAYLRGGTLKVWGNAVTNSSSGGVTLPPTEEDGDTHKHVPSVVDTGGIKYQAKVRHTSAVANKPPNATYWQTTVWQTDVHPAWEAGVVYETTIGYDQIINSYSWNNYLNGTTLWNFANSSSSSPYNSAWFLQENVEFWAHKSSFTATSGMGVGTRAQMNSFTTCTDNVAYWVTDEGSWNISSGDNYLSYTGQGKLYRCSSNTWVAYYEPYTYPHPLRGGTPPTAQDITIDGNNCTSLVQLQCTDSTWPIDTKTMAVSTGVPGTCKYDTSDASYSSMSNTFSTTGETSHSQSLTVDCGSSYSYYVKCGDSDPGVNCLFGVDKDPPPRKTYNITELKLWKSPL